MRSSLFRRVTRYSVGGALDPRENRLTEVTAAALEQVDGLAHEVVVDLLRGACADAERRRLGSAELARRAELLRRATALVAARAAVRTQVATANGRFVDLEILLKPPVGSVDRGVLVWVEVKHGADVHGDQLDAYLQEIERAHAEHDVERIVVVLAPRGWAPMSAGIPPRVAMHAWQSVGRAVRAPAMNGRPAEQRWLTREYVRYLNEEGLMDPDALTATSALALMEENAADAAIAGVCEIADQHVQARWGARGEHKRTSGKVPSPAFGRHYWAHHAPRPDREHGHADLRGGWFEWGLRNTADMQSLDARRGTWAFMAGVTLANKEQALNHPEWHARRLNDGYAYFWISGFYRIARLRYPDELLAETSLEAQGEALATWVVEAFARLAENPPPG